MNRPDNFRARGGSRSGPASFGSPGRLWRSLGPWLTLPLLVLGLAEAGSAREWTLSVDVTEAGVTYVRTVGADSLGSAGYDAGLDVPAPPGAPGEFYAYVVGPPPFDMYDTEIRSSLEPSVSWDLLIQNVGSFTVSWDSTAVPHCVDMTIDGVDMKSAGSISRSGDQVLVIQASPILTGCTWYIRPDQSGDAPTIQAAIDASAYGDSILVAEGTYPENVALTPGRVLWGSWDATFTASSLDATPSVIDGGSTASCIVADLGGAPNDLSVVRGFRLVKGAGTVVASERFGGGLLARGLRHVEHVAVDSCVADRGGGIALLDGGASDSTWMLDVRVRMNNATSAGGGLFAEGLAFLDVEGLQCEGNSCSDELGGSGRRVGGGVALMGGAGSAYFSGAAILSNSAYAFFDDVDGGGIYSEWPACELMDSSVDGNLLANYYGAAGPNEGGGAYLVSGLVRRSTMNSNRIESGSQPLARGGGLRILDGEVTESVIDNNYTGYQGSNSGVYASGDVTIRNCQISRNTGASDCASSAAVGLDGGTIDASLVFGNHGTGYRSGGIDALDALVTNCTVIGNSTDGSSMCGRTASGITARSSQIINTLVSHNRSFSGDIPGLSADSTSTVRHVGFWENGYQSNGFVVFDYAGTATLVDSIVADPMYADSSQGDFRLLLHSPAIDRGDPVIFDPDGSRSDIGAFGGPHGVMEQPEWVQGFVGSGGTGCGAEMDWQASGAPDLMGYAVYRASVSGTHPGLGTFVSTTAGETFQDRHAYPQVPYFYQVSAFDSSGYGGGYSVEAVLAAEPWSGEGVVVNPGTGLAVEGVSANGQFGFGVASGDLNGDGLDDLVASSKGAGHVSIFFGAPGFAPTSESQADVVLSVPTGMPYGGVMATGDVNGDLIADLLIGVPSESPLGRSEAGAAFVYFGRGDWSGAVLPDVAVLGATAGDRISDAAALGDLNDDGFDELVLGAPEAASGSAAHDGKVVVVFGAGSLPDTLDLASYPHLAVLTNTADPIGSGDRFGSAVATDDFTGDGIEDLLIGARAEDSKGVSATGSAQLIAGYSGLEALSTWDLNTTPADLRVDGVGLDDQLGVAVAGVDIDGDGTSAIVLGAWQAERPDGPQTGAIYVVNYADAESTVVDLATDKVWLTLYGREGGDLIGSTLTGGEPALNGKEGLWAGARGASGGSGAAYVVWGGHPCLPAWVDLGLSATDLEMDGPTNAAGAAPLLGSAVTIGDFNGDGRQDYAAGAPGADAGGTDAGMVLIALGPDPTFTPIGAADEPLSLRVSSAWPNPSRGPVSLSITSDGVSATRLDVFDVLGRRVWSGVYSKSVGTSRIGWPGRDQAGRLVSPGTYFLRVRVGEEVFERKATVVR